MNPYLKKKRSTGGVKMAGGGYAMKRKPMGMQKGGEAKKKKSRTGTEVMLDVLKPVDTLAKFVNRNITDKFLNDSGKKDSRQLAKEEYARHRKRWKDKQIKEAGG